MDPARYKGYKDHEQAWLDWLRDDPLMTDFPEPAVSDSSESFEPVQSIAAAPVPAAKPSVQTPVPKPVTPPRPVYTNSVASYQPRDRSAAKHTLEPPKPVYQSAPQIIANAAPSVPPVVVPVTAAATAAPPMARSPLITPLVPAAPMLTAAELAEDSFLTTMPAANFTLNVNLPKLDLRQAAGRVVAKLREGVVIQVPRLSRLPLRQAGIGLAVFGVVVAAGALSHSLLAKHTAQAALSRGRAAASAAVGNAVVHANPTFTPLAPQDKPELATASPTGGAYDGTRDVYSFVDAFNGLQLTVSQQPLPSQYGSAEAAVAAIGKKLQATQVITVALGTALMATDSKSGQQTIIYARDHVLLFIQSPFKHDPLQWPYYLDSLQ